MATADQTILGTECNYCTYITHNWNVVKYFHYFLLLWVWHRLLNLCALIYLYKIMWTLHTKMVLNSHAQTHLCCIDQAESLYSREPGSWHYICWKNPSLTISWPVNANLARRQTDWTLFPLHLTHHSFLANSNRVH